jgi:nitrite reductase/ring-hydroxylating ferredoxin subunit
MGGTLSFRNQIGVDHRYAGAGKWSEAEISARPGEPVAVARSDELEVDQMKLLRLEGGRRLVLARTETGYVAFDDHCTHKGGSLAGGLMACGTVICPWHGSQFDVNTGAARAGPAEQGIRTYPVEQSDGEVRLVLPREARSG